MDRIEVEGFPGGLGGRLILWEGVWYNIAMSYEDAIKKAEEEAKFFPCGREEGE